jgi:Mg-chelatase subunit ChlD
MACQDSLIATVAYGSFGRVDQEDVLEVIISDQIGSIGNLSQKGFVIIIDTSGSMNDDGRIIAVKSALKAQFDILTSRLCDKSIEEVIVMDGTDKTQILINQMGHLSLITFSNWSNLLWTSSTPSSSNLWNIVDNLSCSGNTNLYAGIELGFKQVISAQCQCTVLILTDGLANYGPCHVSFFNDLYAKFPASTNLIAAGIGEKYSSHLIDISPVNFNHVHGQSELIEMSGSVISDLCYASAHQASLNLIDQEGTVMAMGKSLFGQSSLGILINGRGRTFACLPLHGDPDKSKRLADGCRVQLTYTRYDGTFDTIETQVVRQEIIRNEVITNYYSSISARLCAALVDPYNPTPKDKRIEDVESIMSTWTHELATPYRSIINEMIEKVRNGQVNLTDHYIIRQAANTTKTQTTYTSSAGSYIPSTITPTTTALADMTRRLASLLPETSSHNSIQTLLPKFS